ncbi:MAG TPA: Fur family transcriptional regulator [Thermodesulfobacteriota bacterium]|nr:Fur family transcriptional regulator [Thermodesulfobacteriota bacterium]
MKTDDLYIEELTDNFIKRCKEIGIKVTPQRVAIYKELACSDQHPSAEMIYQRIKKYYPNVSLTTIYRTLETFEDLGIVFVVNVLYDAARYDANLEPHHHVVCIKCRKVEDFYDDSLENLRISSMPDYELLGYTVLLNGICKDCQG